jgi:hypothetical protein
MGAGILPTCIYNGKLYFLFGKEHEYCDTPGWSDFGGGTNKIKGIKETYMETAIREGGEELTGFLGSDANLLKLLKKTYPVDYDSANHGTYRMHIFNLSYDPALPYYYNNNQRFIQNHLDKSIIKKSKIFEKAEIRWICIDDLKKMRSQFRSYFQNIVDIILSKRIDIHQFIKNDKSKKNRTKKNISYKRK